MRFSIQQTTTKQFLIPGIETEESSTPTLRQLWLAIRQMQSDMAEIKSQIVQERELRGNLQQILMTHLENIGANAKMSATEPC